MQEFGDSRPSLGGLPPPTFSTKTGTQVSLLQHLLLWAGSREEGGNISRNGQGCRLLAHQPPKLPHCPSPPAASASHFRPVRGCKANTGLCRGLVEPGPAWALGPEPAWPLFPFRQLHSAKRGEGFCPEGACQAPTPAVLGPTPQPCRTSGPSGSHSVSSGSPCGQLTPSAPRASLPLCFSRCYGPEELARPICSTTAPFCTCSLTNFTSIPENLDKVDASPG